MIGLTVHFDRHEDLRTEISTKFTITDIGRELRTGGFSLDRTWCSDEYALVLARADD